MTALQEQLKQQSIMADRQSEQLNTAKSRLQDLESQLDQKSESASSFRQEVERLRQRVEVLLWLWLAANVRLLQADDWLVVLGAGGGAEQQHQCISRHHGGADEGEQGGAAEVCREVPTDRGASGREDAAGGAAAAEVIDPRRCRSASLIRA